MNIHLKHHLAATSIPFLLHRIIFRSLTSYVFRATATMTRKLQSEKCDDTIFMLLHTYFSLSSLRKQFNLTIDPFYLIRYL